MERFDCFHSDLVVGLEFDFSGAASRNIIAGMRHSLGIFGDVVQRDKRCRPCGGQPMPTGREGYRKRTGEVVVPPFCESTR
jgi:hypothetical protein